MSQPVPPEAAPPAPAPAPAPFPPPASRHPWTPWLLAVMVLSLIPALLLAVGRVGYEQAQKTATLVMDYPAMVAQARRFGMEPQALLSRYQALGVGGVAVYEDVVGSLVQRGEVVLRSGTDLLDLAGAPAQAAGVRPQFIYLRSLRPGVAEALPARFTIPTREVTVAGQRWTEWPSDPTFLPVGPDQALLDTLRARKLTVVYRPYGDDAVREPGADWPDVPFIAFNGEEIIGARTPEVLEKVRERLGTRVPALIEFTPQRGLDTLIEERLAEGRGAARLFAMNPVWQGRLSPEEVASKYNLAARERGMRLLYVRPYPSLNETEALLTRTTALLKASGVTLTQPEVRPYQPNRTLQLLSLAGPLAALLLLGLSYPLRRLGLLVAGGCALLAFGLNGLNPLAGAALVAAVTFPALGFVLRRGRVTDWFIATGLSLVGVLFVSALGTTPQSVLGLEPFRGVGLTLMLPLVLVGLSLLPRQDLRTTAAQVYATPLRLGDLAMLGLALAVFALVFLRRGNDTGASVSSTEASLRQTVQDSLVRPRFKEVAAHPLALLGLSGTLPPVVGLALLLGGVLGQASILNTFSHFHTPLLISAQRVFLGLGAGLLVGVFLIWAARLALRLWHAAPGRPPRPGSTGSEVSA